MAIFLVYSTSGITSGEKYCRKLKMVAILKIWNIKHNFNLTSDMKRPSQIMSQKFFYGDDVIDDVKGWPQNVPLHWCLGEVSCGSKLHGQSIVNKCKYHNCLSGLYMPKDDLNEWHFSRLQVKSQHHKLTGWAWHLNGNDSANLGIIKMK